jgi:hypothetical protein
VGEALAAATLVGPHAKDTPALAHRLDEAVQHGALATAVLVDEQHVAVLGDAAELLEASRQGRRREVEIPFPPARERFFFKAESTHR